MNFMEVMIHRLFKGNLEWGLLTPVLGHQVLFARLSAAGRQVKVTPALTDSETATKILESESAWELVLDETAVRIVETDSPDVSGRGSSPLTVPSRISPIVLLREYPDHGLDRFELAEEFRLYHGLSEGAAQGVLVDFDRSGGESVVATVGAEYVTVRKKHLMQFLAGTGRHLVLFADVTDHEKMQGDGRAGIRPVDEVSDVCKKRDSWHDASSAKGNARRLLRKVVFSPPPGGDVGIWPHIPAKETIPFVIGCDSIGNDVEDVSPPGKRRLVEPMAPVFFLDAVLDKYRKSERYKVSSEDLICQERWLCPMSVQHDLGLVMVRYDDLRSRIPPREQLHWRRYNIATNEVGPHAFSDADLDSGGSPSDHLRRETKGVLEEFSAMYERFNSGWRRRKGWNFFEGHRVPVRLDRIKAVPENVDQAEMRAIQLYQLLAEALNAREMWSEVARTPRANLPTGTGGGGPRGIAIPSPTSGNENTKPSVTIKAYLEHLGFPDPCLVADFIRGLGSARRSSAHLEKEEFDGSKNWKVDLDADPMGGILILARGGLDMLRALAAYFLSTPEGDGCRSGPDQESDPD